MLPDSLLYFCTFCLFYLRYLQRQTLYCGVVSCAMYCDPLQTHMEGFGKQLGHIKKVVRLALKYLTVTESTPGHFNKGLMFSISRWVGEPAPSVRLSSACSLTVSSIVSPFLQQSVLCGSCFQGTPFLQPTACFFPFSFQSTASGN